MAVVPEPTDRADWQGVTLLVGLALTTGLLDGYAPQSVLVVGPPAAGKTALLNRFRPYVGDEGRVNESVRFASSISQMGVRAVLQEKSRPTHLIIPEFQTLILRKDAVWDTLLGLFLPLTEEGLYDLWAGNVLEQYHGVRLGVVGAITLDALQNNMKKLEGTGFLSRVLVLYLSRSPANALLARRAFTRGDATELQKITIERRDADRKISITRGAADAIDSYAAEIAPYEIHREANRFRALVAALAYTRGKKTADESDWRDLRSLERLWRGRPKKERE